MTGEHHIADLSGLGPYPSIGVMLFGGVLAALDHFFPEIGSHPGTIIGFMTALLGFISLILGRWFKRNDEKTEQARLASAGSQKTTVDMSKDVRAVLESTEKVEGKMNRMIRLFEEQNDTGDALEKIRGEFSGNRELFGQLKGFVEKTFTELKNDYNGLSIKLDKRMDGLTGKLDKRMDEISADVRDLKSRVGALESKG